ncbi:TIR domain-containing protein [Flagellimonas amoyensis]|uniref:TIR domain-containing protein n=1 Tax=Flagellimonas amoyensis TaxID=2169401 RepID=UPI000D379917|nr:TIR domain-containing protein [Allomuricauda amoyensis]
MLPVILGVGIAALIAKSIFDNNSEEKRIFISFSMKDEKYRNYLVKQSKEERSPFSFVDMSVKKPWAEEKWKTECRKRIVSCDAVIVLLSKNTWHSSGTRWEIKCAKEEGIPIYGMHIQKNKKGAIPKELKGSKIITWTWDNLESIIESV